MKRRFATVVTIALAASSAAIVTAPASSAAAVVMCHGLRATIVGTNQTEELQGTPHNDVIAGLGGSDSIYGGGGNDVICGGDGGDQIYGGPGNDRLYGGRNGLVLLEDGTHSRPADLLNGGAGNDRIVPGVDRRRQGADEFHRDIIDWHLAPHGLTIKVAHGTAVGQGHDTFVGTGAWLYLSNHPDIVYGGPGRDFVLEGLAGDRIYGRGGNDVMDNVSAADVVRGGAGDDAITGGLFRGQAPPVRMYGGPGRDRLTLTRYAGNTAETGIARWNMTTGAFRYTFDAKTIRLTARGFEIGTPDTAHIAARWIVRGTAGDDRLSLANTAAGGTFQALAGNDTFRGSAEDDTFNGGAGTDRSLGMGAGNDTCISVEINNVNDCEIQTP